MIALARLVAALAVLLAAPGPAPAQDPAPGESFAELDQAAKALREGRPDEALALINEGARRHPEWPPSRLILARIYFAIGQNAPGRQALEASIVEEPDNPDIILTFASVNLNEGRLHDAQLNCEKALTLADRMPADSDKARNTRKEAYAGLAGVSENRGQWDQARGHLRSWLEIDPKSGAARQRLGRALFQLGRKDEAFAEMTRGNKDDAKLDPAAVTMAILSAQSGDAKAAREWYDRAIKGEPDSLPARLSYSRWLVEQGEYRPALAQADEAARIDANSKEVAKLRGQITWRERDFPAAEAIFDKIHAETPTDIGASCLLALSLVEQEDSAKRARGLQLAEATVQAAQTVETLSTLARAQYRAGKLDDCEQTLGRASGMGNGQISADTAFFAARLMADRGRVDQARSLLQSIIALPAGSFAYRNEAEELLKKLDAGEGKEAEKATTKEAAKGATKSATPAPKGAPADKKATPKKGE
ncbi:MAG: tetratricopeptide repeat protein [Isosphaeraceae bacterium]